MSSSETGNVAARKRRVDLGIVVAVNGEIEQVVVAEEAVEDLGGQHQRRRHRDANAGKAAGDSPLMQQVADESQPARFAAQRAAADLQEERLRGLKGRRD